MGKKYTNLMVKITESDNFRKAYIQTVKSGNLYTSGNLIFKENLEYNLYLLENELKNGTYKPGEYYEFTVYEPKERLIKALPFRDRVVQHAINNIIKPIFEKVFYKQSYACRRGYGTHRGVRDVQAGIRKLSKNGPVYYLKMDFSKYFASIDQDILYNELFRKIRDLELLKILKLFFNKKDGGIPIGNLLSQLYANIYGHIFDRYIITKIKPDYYFRYMDDTVILSNNKQDLIKFQKELEIFTVNVLKLKFSNWYINGINQPINFLGYRISINYKLVRKNSVTRARRKIKRYIKYNEYNRLVKFLSSWGGHLINSDSYNLMKNIKKEIKDVKPRNKQETIGGYFK